MTAAIKQIVSSYEELGMTLDQICQEYPDLSAESIKSALLSHSKKYRDDNNLPQNKAVLDFSDEQLERVNQVIYDLALAAEDEQLRFKAAVFVRNDRKGRLEPAKMLNGSNTFNLFQFNEALQNGRQAAATIKAKVTQKSIDV